MTKPPTEPSDSSANLPITPADSEVDALIFGMNGDDEEKPAAVEKAVEKKAPDADRKKGEVAAKPEKQKKKVVVLDPQKAKYHPGKGLAVNGKLVFRVAEVDQLIKLAPKQKGDSFPVKRKNGIVLQVPKSLIKVLEGVRTKEKAPAKQKPAKAAKKPEAPSQEVRDLQDSFAEFLAADDSGDFTLAPEVPETKSLKTAPVIETIPEVSAVSPAPVGTAKPKKAAGSLLEAFKGGNNYYGNISTKVKAKKIATAMNTALADKMIKARVENLLGEAIPTNAEVLTDANLRRLRALKKPVLVLQAAESLKEMKKASGMFASVPIDAVFKGYSKNPQEAVTDEKIKDLALASFVVSFDAVHKDLGSKKQAPSKQQAAAKGFENSIKILSAIKGERDSAKTDLENA